MQNRSNNSLAKKLQTPDFKSEADEARWYEKNQDASAGRVQGCPDGWPAGAGFPCEARLDPNSHDTAGQARHRTGETAGGAERACGIRRI